MPLKKEIAILFLAAGGSSRLGQPKQLLNISGQPLIVWMLEKILQADLGDVFVVTGAFKEEVELAIQDLSVRAIHNRDWKAGMGHSISAGVRTVKETDKYEWILILTCDQYLISGHYLQSLLEAAINSKSKIVASQYAGQLGVPALFHRDFFTELAYMKKDRGAKRIILENIDQVKALSFPEGVMDVDTERDYLELLEKLRN